MLYSFMFHLINSVKLHGDTQRDIEGGGKEKERVGGREGGRKTENLFSIAWMVLNVYEFWALIGIE